MSILKNNARYVEQHKSGQRNERIITWKNRNYSCSKLIQPKQSLSEINQKQEELKKSKQYETIGGKNDVKKYCVDKVKPKEQFRIGIKKDISLKIFKKEEKFKPVSDTNIHYYNDYEIMQKIDGHEKESSLEKALSFKRKGAHLIKNLNKLKISTDEKNKIETQMNSDRSNVSFEEQLVKKQVSTNPCSKIKSENMLGEGLKKCSSKKIKILVRNPFEKHIKCSNVIESSSKIADIHEKSIEQLKESKIYENGNASFFSTSQQNDLYQLIKLI